MAKIKRQLFGLSGRLGDEVYVHRPGHKDYVRRRPRPGSKRNEPALKQNYTRTRKLDSLAAAINRIVKTESDGHKHAEFYFKLLACFRKQTSDNRFLLLTSLKGMDIHPLYTLDRLQGEQEIVVKPGKKNIKVILRVKNHPGELDNIDCYCYDVLLLTWKNRAKTPGYCRQLSDWIYLDKAKPEFEFSFEKPGDIREWMLCLKKNMELNKENVSLKLQGMRIMEVGTFDKKDIALLKKIAAKEKKRNSYSKNEKVQMVRVKAKKRREK